MNSSALITLSLQLAVRPFVLLWAFFKKVALAVFGRLQWSPPHWLTRNRAAFSAFNRAHPRITASGIVTIFLLSCGAAWTLHWYQHRPVPHKVTATIASPPITKLEKELKYPPLLVRFSEPAARLEDLKKPSLSGVRLEPKITGAWSWNSDKELAFRPTQDWPADQTFKITFDKKFFPPQVLMERLAYEFQTAPFDIAIKELQLYQDPANPTQRQITATLELTHAVEPGELDRHIQLQMIGGSNVFPPSESPPHFTITYGLHNRLAYVRSSNVTLPEREDFMKLYLSKGVRTAQGGAQTRNSAEDKVRIPSQETAFQIDSIAATIARNKNGEPEQVLILSTTADISSSELAKAIQIRLLPKRNAETTDETEGEAAGETDSQSPDSETAEQSNQSSQTTASEDEETEGTEEPDQASKWQSPAEVPDDVLEQAKRIEFTVVPSEKAQDRQHAFKIRLETEGELYVRVAKGVRALWRRSNSKSRTLLPPRSITSLARARANSRTRNFAIPIYSIKKISRVSESNTNRLRRKTNGKRIIRRSISPSIFANQPMAGASAGFSF